MLNIYNPLPTQPIIYEQPVPVIRNRILLGVSSDVFKHKQGGFHHHDESPLFYWFLRICVFFKINDVKFSQMLFLIY